MSIGDVIVVRLDVRSKRPGGQIAFVCLVRRTVLKAVRRFVGLLQSLLLVFLSLFQSLINESAEDDDHQIEQVEQYEGCGARRFD